MLSIVIPSYARESDLSQCLASLRQNSETSCEIVVLTPEITPTVRSLCMEYSAIVKNDNSRTNGKRSRSLWSIINQGIELAKNDFVCWINDDCLVNKNWDRIALSYFDENVGIVVLKTKGINRNPRYEVKHGFFDFPLANYGIIRKSAGVRFDDNFNWFYGDADISLQMAMQTNLRIVETQEGLVIHAHRLDLVRAENEADPRARADQHYFDRKWKLRKRVGHRIVEMNFLEKIWAVCVEEMRNVYHFLTRIARKRR